MKAVAAQALSHPAPASKHRPETPARVLALPVPFSGVDIPTIQRKASCACGGGCPRCEGSLPIQRKLAVSQPADQHELEADRIADQVMRMPAPTLQRTCASCSGGGPTCSKCGEEKLVQAKLGPVSARSNGSVSDSFVRGLGSGEPLGSGTRAFMEPRFGHDFSRVRVHTDASAAESARAVNALAYTFGRNIVFDQGRFSPQTDDGKRLLAHELAHVVQQADDSPAMISRFTDADFSIVGLAPSLATVNNVIRFHYNGVTIPSVEDHKIIAQASPPGRDITLNGYASEEGNLASRTATIGTRINAVSSALAARGHAAPRHPNPDPTGGESRMDYRGMRIVEIVDTPVGGAPIPTSVPSCTTISTPCGTTYSTAFPVAQTFVAAATAALTTPSSATLAQVTTFFGATPASTLLTHINSLTTEMTAINSVHNGANDCHLTQCDGGCVGATAYVNVSITPHRMILCDDYRATTSPDERAQTLIHETLHATPGLLTKDIAYAHTRRIRTLNDTEKLKNTDNWVNLITILHDPTATITTPPADTIAATTTAAEAAFAQRAIDFLEQWLIAAKFGSGDLYETIDTALSTPATWTTATRQWFHRRMHELSPLFGLTDPGIAAPFGLPVRADKIRVAGIHDRYERMRGVLWSRTIALTKITSGSDAWAANLGSTVDVTGPFFLMTEINAIKHLLKLMLQSMSDVPASLVNNYVDGVNSIRTQRGVGP